MSPIAGEGGSRRTRLRYREGDDPYELVFVPRSIARGRRWRRGLSVPPGLVVAAAALVAGPLLLLSRAEGERAARGDEVNPSQLPVERVVRRATLKRDTPAAGAGPARGPARSVVYVPESLVRTVAVIDAQTYRVIRRIRVGHEPQNVTVAPDRSRIYAGAAASDRLTVINAKSGAASRQLPILDPYALYFTPDGSAAIVVAHRKGDLRLFDLSRWTRLGVIDLPGRTAGHLAFTADGRFAIVTDDSGGRLVKVDLKRLRVVAMRRLRGSPVDVERAPANALFYVADQARGGILVADGRTLRVLRFIRTGAGAHGLALDRDRGVLYVANRRGGSITAIKLATQRPVATWRVGGSPDGLQLSPSGRELWISNRFHSSVSVVDTRSGRVRHRISVNAGPHGLVYVEARASASSG